MIDNNKLQLFEDLQKEIKEFLYSKLCVLLRNDLLCSYPKHKKDEDILSIRNFIFYENKLECEYDIHWSGDVYDDKVISMTIEEWNNVN